MTRSFTQEPVPQSVINHLVGLASRAPSAGKSQGLHVITLSGDSLAQFWDAAFPSDARHDFKWPGLFNAPVVTLWLADPDAYVARYSEPDKLRTGLGAGPDAWPTPYWTVDCSMAMGTFLLGVQAQGLGALLFAVFNNVANVRETFGINERLQILGAIAVGVPSAEDSPKGRSASRTRRTVDEIIHRDRW